MSIVTVNGRLVDQGKKVHELLVNKGIETPGVGTERSLHTPQNPDQVIRLSTESILRALGLNLRDDSLQNTPRRVAKMYTQEIFWGLNYANFPEMTAIANKMKYDEVLATKCTVRSMCEHHLVPFIGVCWIGYLPKTKVLGLSKFNRLVDFFSRRPQVQERLTAQITASLQYILGTQDVACVIRASHYCVHLRGVQDTLSETVTSQMGGRFLRKPALRQEFLDLTR